jgi:hypothetical protein
MSQKLTWANVGDFVKEIKKNPQAIKALRKEYDKFLKDNAGKNVEEVLKDVHKDVRSYFDDEADEDLNHKSTPEDTKDDA